MIGYKGFDKDFKCRDFQYEVGQTYKLDGEMELCKCGFHFCDTPLAVFEYYPPTKSRYALVEAAGKITSDKEHKFCTDEIKIVEELTLEEFVQEAVKLNGDSMATSRDCRSTTISIGDCSLATSTSYCSTATNTGYRSAATSTGFRSVATNTGDCSAATSTGKCSAVANTGFRSVAMTKDDCSAATNTGNCSLAITKGNRSMAANTGDWSAAIVTDEDSIAFVTGRESKAKGSIGCWLVLTEWDNIGRIIEVKAVKVDGEKIKADTFYMLKGGQVVEVED